MTIILSILTYILNNLPALILAITTCITLYNNFKNKKKLTDADVLQNINDLVSQAESLYKAGNGDVKLAYVKQQLKTKYPKVDVDGLEDTIKASVKVFNDFRDNGRIDSK